MQDILKKAAEIRLVIFDVDGVLTDGRLYFDEQGHEYKAFHSRDGLGIKLLQKSGIDIAVISGRSARSTELRMQNLGIRHIYLGRENKAEALEDLCRKTGLSARQMAHVGDDLVDLPVMRRVGLGIAVQDAHFALAEYADWTTTQPGGLGAARDVCDLLLRAHGKLDDIIQGYAGAADI